MPVAIPTPDWEISRRPAQWLQRAESEALPEPAETLPAWRATHRNLLERNLLLTEARELLEQTATTQ